MKNCSIQDHWGPLSKPLNVPNACYQIFLHKQYGVTSDCVGWCFFRKQWHTAVNLAKCSSVSGRFSKHQAAATTCHCSVKSFCAASSASHSVMCLFVRLYVLLLCTCLMLCACVVCVKPWSHLWKVYNTSLMQLSYYQTLQFVVINTV